MADAPLRTHPPAVYGAVPPLNEHDAARYLGVTIHRLRASRLRSGAICDGPPYIQMGRTVRYAIGDLDRWLAERRVVPATAWLPRD